MFRFLLTVRILTVSYTHLMITYRTEEGIEVSFEAKIAVEGEDDSSDDEDLKPSDEPSAEPTESPDDSEAPSAGRCV